MLRVAAKTYAERRTALIGALADRGVRAIARSGLNVWVPVPEEHPVVTGLLLNGWAVAPGARFRIASPPAVRITTARLETADAEPLAEKLAECLTPPGALRLA
jgi:DNA-binding transcriptional MocR family regulator